MSEREPFKNRPRDGRPLGEPVQFGAVRFAETIAVGGMSEVYLARPRVGTSPAAELVIKRLLPSMLDDPRGRRTFEIEASLTPPRGIPTWSRCSSQARSTASPTWRWSSWSASTFRLMRRVQSEARQCPPAVAIYIARELCKALACVTA